MFTGGYPVTGGLSRSVVNFAEAGANSGLASIMTGCSHRSHRDISDPRLYFLPQAILAAIVIVAVAGLIDVKTFRHVWRYNSADAASFVVTFVAVLLVGVENGILLGVAVAMFSFHSRRGAPAVMAVVGRLGSSETYRNVLRHKVQCWPNVVAVRIDESLYFANSKFLEDTVLGLVADQPEVDHFVLIELAVNFIDASALKRWNQAAAPAERCWCSFTWRRLRGQCWTACGISALSITWVSRSSTSPPTTR